MKLNIIQLFQLFHDGTKLRIWWSSRPQKNNPCNPAKGKCVFSVPAQMPYVPIPTGVVNRYQARLG